MTTTCAECRRDRQPSTRGQGTGSGVSAGSAGRGPDDERRLHPGHGHAADQHLAKNTQGLPPPASAPRERASPDKEGHPQPQPDALLGPSCELPHLRHELRLHHCIGIVDVAASAAAVPDRRSCAEINKVLAALPELAAASALPASVCSGPHTVARAGSGHLPPSLEEALPWLRAEAAAILGAATAGGEGCGGEASGAAPGEAVDSAGVLGPSGHSTGSLANERSVGACRALGPRG
mmetsp:Transcript_69848/g.227262  ORF Transcript_69848/g.227262 Transcript_69848/m.227262 type:complete len:236 (-) Transcript_69848:248-955(-)